MRRFAWVLAAALVVASCADAFEPPPEDGVGPGAPTAPSTFPTSEPTPTAMPSPAAVPIAELPKEGDPMRVVVLGWVRTGGSVLCGSGTCIIDLVDPANPRRRISLEVPTGDGATPGTMRSLGSGYAESDLAIVPATGATVHAGDHVRVTGWWTPERRTLAADVIARAGIPSLKPVATSIGKLRSRKDGTLVKVTGRLATPFLLSCMGGTCNLYLEDAGNDARTVRIEVRLGPAKGSRPNTMRPLGDNFTASQLRVFDAKKRTCRAGERVQVVGWVYRTEDGKPYIDPVRTITRLGK